MSALSSSQGLIAVYGKRGVGKSSLLRQIQHMAAGSYDIAYKAGLGHLVPQTPRRYYTVFYSCDATIQNLGDLISRLCNDPDPEDGLLRLAPDKGKELVEFSRTSETSTGLDLKLGHWGKTGADSSRYTSTVPGDTIQTFRNFATSIVDANNRIWNKRDAVLIMIDEFDIIRNKEDIGSLIKSLSGPKVKFALCGIGQDLSALIRDHKSVARLIEQGAVHVKPMSVEETALIFEVAELLYDEKLRFAKQVVNRIAECCDGYPYFAQLIGKSCVQHANKMGINLIDDKVFEKILDDIRAGTSFPNLEEQYQLAVGNSEDRKLLLTLLAEQSAQETEYNENISRVVLKRSRSTAQELGIEYVDQLLPRLIEERYGPVLVRTSEQRGAYEFADPVFRAYVKLRRLA